MGEPSTDAGTIDVPDYVVGDQIGRGGFGDVFRARHAVLGREVAIKVLHAAYARDPAAVARFVAEARAVNLIDHPAIVDVFDFGQLADGRQYYVMELIRGRTLREVLRERGRLPLDEALPLLRGIADAVDAAHGAGIAHRDLKPDNVFVTPGGAVKLIDFGLAKLTRSEEVAVTETGAVFGSPLYMSPEQCRGKGVELATDAYAFGVVAFQLLTGETPFTGEPLAVALQHLNDPPPPSGQPPHVEATLRALLAKEPADRPRPLARAVDALAGIGVPRRRRRGVAIVAGLALLGVAVAAVALGTRRRPAASPHRVTFTKRKLEIPSDGQIYDLTFLHGGAQLGYHDRSGMFAVDLASGSIDVPVAFHGSGRDHQDLPDGQWLLAEGDFDTAISKSGMRIHLEDPATGTSRDLTTGAFPAASPDGTQIALFQDGWLVVYDRGDGTVRRLAHHGLAAVLTRPHWSRDGAWLAWGAYSEPSATRRVQLTRVSDGETRSMPFRVANDAMNHPAAFLDDGRLVYCANDARGKQVRAHDPAEPSADADEVLAELPPTVSRCELESTAGDRVAVAVELGVGNLGVIDLAAPVPEAKLFTSATPQIVADVDPIAHRAFVFTDGALAPGLGGRFQGPPALISYDLPTHVETQESTCPGDVGVVWRTDRLVHVALRDDAVELREHGSCAVIERWRVPAGKWSLPRCGPVDCFVLRAADGLLEVQRLTPGAGEGALLARVEPGTNRFEPSLAVSPDGKALVVLACGGGLVQVISTSDGTSTPHPMQGAPVSVAWGGDPNQFFVAGQLFDDLQFAIRAVSLDGTQRIAWSSPDREITRLLAERTSSYVLGTVTIRSMELWLLEPARPAS